jgi:hypothetical protein
MARARPTTSASRDRRAAATAELLAAAGTINSMFDHEDRLRGLLADCVTAAGDGDTVRAARTVIDLAARIDTEHHELLDAASAATAYRSRRELAADLDTSVTLLFPRAQRAEQPTSPIEPPTASAATAMSGSGR